MRRNVYTYHEDVVCVRNLTTSAEQFKKIVELSMDVSADGDRAGDGLDVGFFQKKLLYL